MAIVEQARIEAEGIIAAAQQQAESIFSDAERQGYEAGLAQLQEEREALAEKMAGLDAEMSAQIEEFWTETEPEVLHLAVEIARKVVKRELDENSEFILGTVRAAIRQLRDRADLKIRVSPDDHALVREHKEEIMSSCDGIRNIEVIEDRRVGDGGCLIESAGGTLDARVDAQISEIERALMEAADSGGSSATTES
jgi:flagellar biosynthesis/type III secretory pathway protein FliH